MTITKRGVGSLSDLLQKRMGEMILRAGPETLMAVSLLRTKTRRGKGEDAAGEEIRILLEDLVPTSGHGEIGPIRAKMTHFYGRFCSVSQPLDIIFLKSKVMNL